jgi:hypothetical protein
LTRVGQRHKLSNLLWLAGFFYITGTGDIFITLSPVTNIIWPFFLAVGFGEVMLVMFIQKTFYQDRKSPYLIFMVIALAIFGASLYMLANQMAFLPYYSPFNWLWLIWVGYQAYKKIATDQTVEDWVKARYKLIIAYSLAALVAPIYTILTLLPFVIPSVAVWLFAPTSILVAQVGILVFVTIGIALEYLAWVMPERYRRYLNRNYRAPMPDEAELGLSEEEIIQRLQDRP